MKMERAERRRNSVECQSFGRCRCGLKCVLLFLVGACVYYNVEICFRGYSHWSMALLGGILFIIIGNLNERASNWCRSALHGIGTGGALGSIGGGQKYGRNGSDKGAHQVGGTAAGKIGIPLIVQGIIAACIITAGELAAGLVLNVWLGLKIWDYSDMPFNFLGQICLKFSLLWIGAGMIAVVLDDYLRYLLFGEEKPKYRII